MVKNLTCILFILIIIYQNTAQTKTFLKKHFEKDLNEDIDILKSVLLKMHPSVGFYHSIDWYKNYFDTALRVQHELNEKEFRNFLIKKLQVLHCGHTSIIPSTTYKKYLNKKPFNVIPYYMAYFEPYLINIKGIGTQDTLLHTFDTIIKIDNESLKKYADEFKNYLYVDANAFSARDEMIQKNFAFYYSSLHDEKDSILITKLHHNKTSDIFLKTRKYHKLNNILWQMKSDTLMKKYGRKYYTGVYLDQNKNVFYMKIKSFSGIGMKGFYRKTFKKLKKNNTNVLILDLRNNPGGKISQCVKLLSYLLAKTDSIFYETRINKIEYKKYIRKKMEYRIIKTFMKITKKRQGEKYIEIIKPNKKYHYDKYLYVITNCNSFSAANLVSVYLSEKRPQTKTVGTEASGAIWGSNAISFLKLNLPHSKIRILIPTFRIYHNIKNVNNKNIMYAVKPDIYVHYSPSDYLYKKDKALEFIYYNLIKK